MTDRSVGPRCGNNPNVQLTPGDLKAVDDAKARLALLADARPYIDRAVWVDGDPLMEVIASTLWKHCARDDEDMPQLVCDDPRTIAAFAAAVARAHAAVPAPATDQAALRDRIAEALYAHDQPGHRVPLNETGMQPAYRESADAVLSVLPAPADRRGIKDVMGPADGQQKMRLLADFHANATPVPATTGRAAVLRELADQQEATATTDVIRKRRSIATARRLFAVELRRMADETQQPETEPAADPQPVSDEFVQQLATVKVREDSETLRCVCGETAVRSGDDWVHEPGKGGTCMYRPKARPRCPDCQTPHDLTPGGMGVRACASILASLADRGAAVQQPKEAENLRAVCVCGHTRAEHLVVSGRLLCDACDPDSTDNLVCKEFEAL